MPSSRSEKEEMIQIAESTKMKKAIEKELRELDPKALTAEGKIKTYKIENNKLDFNPMGGLDIYLIINDNKKFELDMTFQENSTTGEYETGGYGMSPEFNELITIDGSEYTDKQLVEAYLYEYEGVHVGKEYDVKGRII